MVEKFFSSKRGVLEYLGKSLEDRKLVDRMIRKGEIEKTEDWYRLIQKGDDELEKLKAEYKEARVQRLYYADEYEKEKKDKENRIRKCFQWIKAKNPKVNWEEFRDRVMSDGE